MPIFDSCEQDVEIWYDIAEWFAVRINGTLCPDCVIDWAADFGDARGFAVWSAPDSDVFLLYRSQMQGALAPGVITVTATVTCGEGAGAQTFGPFVSTITLLGPED